MGGYVCTIAGGKGGVGKTTTAVNLAAAVEATGHEAVVVDADLAMANLGELLDIDVDVSIHDVLSDEATVSEALTPGPAGLSLIPGEQRLEAFAEADPAKLRKVITTLRESHDAVFVDTGAGLSHETAVPLGLADGVLLVSTPDDVAISDTVKTAELARRVDGNVIGTVLANVSASTDMSGIDTSFDAPVLGVIPADDVTDRAEPRVRNHPDSNVAGAYTHLAQELERVFFEGATSDQIEPVYDAAWFDDGVGNAGEAGSADEERTEPTRGLLGRLLG